MNEPQPHVSTDQVNLAPPEDPDEIGRLGPYRVLKLIGRGSMGIVYEAEDPRLGRTVALKVMQPILGADPAARQRFLREARLTSVLDHENIVIVYEVGEDRGLSYLAMQILQGETLEDRLERDGRLPVPDVLRIGREIAEGLEAAHAHGLIHRDIKPANVWVETLPGPTRRERVKILDFGMARPLEVSTQLTDSGAVAGTPAYMAPEQASNGPIDHRCDLFSLGCVLYHMLTGELPFHGDNLLALMLAIEEETPRPPNLSNPEVSQDLADLVLWLLAKTAADRPPTARAVSNCLAAIADGQPMPLRKPGGPASSRRKRWFSGAAAVILVAILASGTWLYSSLWKSDTAAEAMEDDAGRTTGNQQNEPLLAQDSKSMRADLEEPLDPRVLASIETLFEKFNGRDLRALYKEVGTVENQLRRDSDEAEAVARHVLQRKAEIVTEPDVVRVLDRLVSDKKPELAAELLLRIMRSRATVIAYNKGAVVVGRLVVADGKTEPELVVPGTAGRGSPDAAKR